jgi:hypothetical protein
MCGCRKFKICVVGQSVNKSIKGVDKKMSLDYVNPMENLYQSFIDILKNIVIKYQKSADVYETGEMTGRADEYIDAYRKVDTFFTYSDYTEEEIIQAGITEYSKIQEIMKNSLKVPTDNYNYQAHYEKYLSERGLTNHDLSFIDFRSMIIDGRIIEEPIFGIRYRDKLLNIRRKHIVDNYDEPNNYYRMLNGLPNIEVDAKYFYYLPDNIIETLGLNPDEIESIRTVPVHKIQDYYNKLDTKNGIRGDIIMKLVEGTGYIDVLKNASRINGNIIYGGTFDGIYAYINDNAREALGIDQNIHPATKITLMNNYTSSSFDEDGNGFFGYRANKDVYYVVTTTCSFADLTINRGDWLVSDGDKWYFINNTINVDGTSDGYTQYLNYLGSKRINIDKARRSKNFDILRLDKNIVSSNVYDSFVDIYEQCRNYVTSTLYIYNFRSFFNYYDNFTAMCIMVMTELYMISKQIPFEVRRNFFDIYALSMLYEAYNFPYNINVDIDTQNLIVKNLNMMLQNKATNKVIYDIAHLLGFTNITAYKYYLAKEHKMDSYGIPIFKTKKEFNTDTGEVEEVPDYDAMFDIYFQKEELNEDDFIQAFNSKINKTKYEEITAGDPYWWEDQTLVDRKNTAEYNFVEAKYLSLGISYQMTDILFENMIMFKLLFEHANTISDVSIALPKIIQGSAMPLFDVIILLLCIVSKSHKLTGEIVSTPSDIVYVLDYLNNGMSRGEINTFAFDFDYFFKSQSNEDLADVICALSKSKYTFRKSNSEKDNPRYLVVSDYDPDNPELQISYDDLMYDIGTEYNVGDYVTPFRSIRRDTALNIAVLLRQGLDIHTIAELLDTDCDETISSDIEVILDYISVLSIDSTATPEEKVKTINKMYSNIKGLYSFMNNRIREESDIDTYRALRTFYDACFYTTEIRDIFAIKYRDSGNIMKNRTAKNFFEYLYYKNPILYSSVFDMQYDVEYDKYMSIKKDGEPVTKYIYSNEETPGSITVTQEMLNDDWTLDGVKYTAVKLSLPYARVGDIISILSSNPTYVEFCQYVDSGVIDIRFDNVKNIDNSNTSSDALSSTLYYYANHIIARIKTELDGIDYEYMVNDMSSLLHDLLVKLVKFVKSYTVDFVGLDQIIKYNFRVENLLRLMDKEGKITKSISPTENLNLTFSDYSFINAQINARSDNWFNDLARRIYMVNPDSIESMVYPYKYGINELYHLSYDDGVKYDVTPSEITTPYAYYHRIKLIPDSNIIDSDAGTTESNTYLEIAGPNIIESPAVLNHQIPYMSNPDEQGIRLVYGDGYISDPSNYPGMRIVFDNYESTALSNKYTDHNIFENSYIYTIYIVCRAIDIEDVLESASIRFVTTPLLDIYTGAGIETIGVREYNTDSDTYDMSFKDGVITDEYARDWHVIAVSQNLNNGKVYIDGKCVLDKTFNLRTDFTNGTTDDFKIRFMPNDMIGINMKDVTNDGYASYKCPVDYRLVMMANKAHHSSELRENSKYIMRRVMDKQYDK